MDNSYNTSMSTSQNIRKENIQKGHRQKRHIILKISIRMLCNKGGDPVYDIVRLVIDMPDARNNIS